MSSPVSSSIRSFIVIRSDGYGLVYGRIMSSFTPWGGTVVVKVVEKVPRFFWRQSSRTCWGVLKPRSVNLRVICFGASYKGAMLKRPTAFAPSCISLAHISYVASAAICVACWARGSWFTANTSSFVRRFRVKSSSWVRSQPNSSGEARSDHRVMWVYCSSGVRLEGWRSGPQPTLPTTSMSASLNRPGAAKGDHLPWAKPIEAMLSQVSVMSPVVRHEFASFDQLAALSKGALLDRL